MHLPNKPGIAYIFSLGVLVSIWCFIMSLSMPVNVNMIICICNWWTISTTLTYKIKHNIYSNFAFTPFFLDQNNGVWWIVLHNEAVVLFVLYFFKNSYRVFLQLILSNAHFSEYHSSLNTCIYNTLFPKQIRYLPVNIHLCVVIIFFFFVQKVMFFFLYFLSPDKLLFAYTILWDRI